MPTSDRAPAVILASLAILAVLLPIAGCGGGDDEAAGETAHLFAQSNGPVTRAKFIEQADALCRRTSAIVHDGIQPYIDEGLKAVEGPAVAGGMVRDIVAPGLETQVVALRTLDWPAADSKKIDAILAAIEKVAEDGRADPHELILHHERALARARRLAEGYGLSDCGKLWIALPDSGDEASQDEGGEEDKAEFIEHADSLCRRANAIVQEGLLPYIKKDPRELRRPAVVAKMVHDVVAIELEAQDSAIKFLHGPTDDKKEIKAVLSALEEVEENGAEDPQELIFHSHRAFAAARHLAETYGFSYCGKLWIVLPNTNNG